MITLSLFKDNSTSSIGPSPWISGTWKGSGPRGPPDEEDPDDWSGRPTRLRGFEGSSEATVTGGVDRPVGVIITECKRILRRARLGPGKEPT